MSRVSRNPIPVFIGGFGVALFVSILVSAFYPDTTNEAWVTLMGGLEQYILDLLEATPGIVVAFVIVGTSLFVVAGILLMAVNGIRSIIA